MTEVLKLTRLRQEVKVKEDGLGWSTFMESREGDEVVTISLGT